MKYLIEPFIYPIMDGNECVGQGFFADNYFITAAHVIKENPNCYIMLEGLKVPLCSYKYSYGRKVLDAYYVGKGDSYKDANQIDLILYKIGNSESPLHLNIHHPKYGEILKSHCVHPVFDSKTNKYHNEYSVEDALVLGEEEGNYFYCKCKRFCGSSGSPLLWENQVVGIMYGGDSEHLYCSFLKIESFIHDIDVELTYDKSEVIHKLLPHGIDRIKAIVILHALNADLALMGINLSQEGIYETGYYAVLDNLPFRISELTDEERIVLDEYCTNIVMQF